MFSILKCHLRKKTGVFLPSQSEICKNLNANSYLPEKFCPALYMYCRLLLFQNGRFLASGSRDRYLNLIDLSKHDQDNPNDVKQMKVYSSDKAHKVTTKCTLNFLWNVLEGDVVTLLWFLQSLCLSIHDTLISRKKYRQLCRYVYNVERLNTIKFGGQRSKVKVTKDKDGNNFVNMIEIIDYFDQTLYICFL